MLPSSPSARFNGRKFLTVKKGSKSCLTATHISHFSYIFRNSSCIKFSCVIYYSKLPARNSKTVFYENQGIHAFLPHRKSQYEIYEVMRLCNSAKQQFSFFYRSIESSNILILIPFEIFPFIIFLLVVSLSLILLYSLTSTFLQIYLFAALLTCFNWNILALLLHKFDISLTVNCQHDLFEKL